MTASLDPNQIAHATAQEVERYLQESALPKALETAHDAGVDACREFDWSKANRWFVRDLLTRFTNNVQHVPHDVNYAHGFYDALISAISALSDRLRDYELDSKGFHQLLDYLDAYGPGFFDLDDALRAFNYKE